MRPASASLAALTLLALCVGRANGAMPAVRVEVDAPAECMTKQDLIARVQARVPRLRLGEEDAAWIVRAVFAVPRSGRVVAEIAITGSNGKASTRQIVARSCEEAAEGVALIIAVTLDQPNATGQAPVVLDVQPSSTVGEPAASPSPSSASAASASPPEPASATSSASPNVAVVPRPGPATADRAETPLPPGTARWRVRVEAAAESLLGPAPTVMPAVSVDGVVAHDRDALWSPAFLVGLTHAWTTGLSEPGGKASFMLDALNVDGCPLRVHVSVFDARVCGSALLGRFMASGTSTRFPATVARPFAMVGAAAIVAAHLGSTFALSTRWAAGADVVRDSFEFTPVIFYRAAAVTVSGSIGVSVLLP